MNLVGFLYLPLQVTCFKACPGLDPGLHDLQMGRLLSNLTEHTISSESIYSGVLLHVYRDIVRTPGGEEAVREWIDHPGAAAIVPIFDDGTTLLLRQYRYPARNAFLETPAGKLDPGESPEETAARELEEETGWKARRLVALGSLYPCIGYSNEVIHVFAALDLSKGRLARDSDEFFEVVRVPLLEAVDRVKAGDIRDMKTALALRMAGEYAASVGSSLRKGH